MNLKDPKPCPFQHDCHNFTEAQNGNCGCEFEDVLECWVELDEEEVNRCKVPRQIGSLVVRCVQRDGEAK